MTLAELLGEPRVITDRAEAIALLKKCAEETTMDFSKEIGWLEKLPIAKLEVHRDGIRFIGAKEEMDVEFITTEMGSFAHGREPFVLRAAKLATRAAADLLAFGAPEQTEPVPKSLKALVDYFQQTIVEDGRRFENVMSRLEKYGFKLGALNTLLLDAVHTGLSSASARRLADELGQFVPAFARVYLDAQASERFYRKELSGQLDALYNI